MVVAFLSRATTPGCLQDAATGEWYPAVASLNVNASALVLLAPDAPAGAVANATANGPGVWPLVSLYAAQGSGGLPAYPWVPTAVQNEHQQWVIASSS